MRSRLSGDPSARNARISSGVGGRPITLRNTRLRKVASSASSEGGSLSSLSLANRWSSIRLFVGGSDQVNPSTGSRKIRRVVATSVSKLIRIVVSPVPTLRTSPPGSIVATL